MFQMYVSYWQTDRSTITKANKNLIPIKYIYIEFVFVYTHHPMLELKRNVKVIVIEFHQKKKKKEKKIVIVSVFTHDILDEPGMIKFLW